MEDLKAKFNQIYPGKFFLEQDQLQATTDYLKSQNWLSGDDQIVKMEKPGEGNVNFVLRVIPEKSKSFILKQARPWVEKFPQIEAPVSRIQVEYQYFQTVNQNEKLKPYSPEIIGYDPDNLIMAIEDLGKASDLTHIYKNGQNLSQEKVEQAVAYLNNLRKLPEPQDFPDNLEMRKLNYQHIFYLPYIEDNGFNLDDIQPGLQRLSEPCKKDKGLKEIIKSLGDVYLGEGTQLLHGDFFPGSLLDVGENIKVIDPEFGFVGPQEWDIAIFIAHLFLADTPVDAIQHANSQYKRPSGFSEERIAGFIGTEILRRLIGLAQLPLEMEIEQKARLIDQASQWIKNGRIDILAS